MRGARALLFSGLMMACALTSLAHAEQDPMSGSFDTRMRYVAYNPGQVVHLSTIVGDTMVVSFSPTETVTSVAETDTIPSGCRPKGQLSFFEAECTARIATDYCPDPAGGWFAASIRVRDRDRECGDHGERG